MSVLVTMRVKVHNFEGTKQAVAKYGESQRAAGVSFRLNRKEIRPHVG